MHITELGWDTFFAQHFEPFRPQGFVPARIAVLEKQVYVVYGEFGESLAKLSGKFRHQVHANVELPAVGDWVALRPDATQPTIQAVLPRRSSLTRRLPAAGGAKVRMLNGRMRVVAGATEEQVLAANINTLLLVMALDDDYNLRRLERFLTSLQNRGITPVIVLNKADLCADSENRQEQVQMLTPTISVHIISALERRGLEALATYLNPGQTLVLLGSSGVGKSTLINAFLGEDRQKIGAVNAVTGHGRHITTHRELVLLPTGAMLIDNPGIRALRLWADEDDVHASFTDIDELVQQCQFKRCSHTTEAGCAIQAAIASGALDAKRYHNYCKQTGEVHYLEHRQREKYHRDLKIWRRTMRTKAEERFE